MRKATAKASVSHLSSPRASGVTNDKLSPEARLERFNTLYQFLADRVGTHPPARAVKAPEQVRTTAWSHLFGLATTEAQLTKVAELFPLWRDAKRKFSPKIAEAFVRAYLLWCQWCEVADCSSPRSL